MPGNFMPKRPPVNVGDELDVTIEAVGAKGDGIARKDGFILFIPNTEEGQQVHIKVNKVLNKVGFADVFSPGEKESKPAAEPERQDVSDEHEEELPPVPDVSEEHKDEFDEMEADLPPPPEDD